MTISVPEDGSTHYISELDASPIGFAVDHVISADELMYIDVSLRGIAMLDSAAMDPDDTVKVADVAPQWSVVDIDYDIPVAEYAERNKARAVSDFVRDGHGFNCTSDYDTSKLVYFSVPYDGYSGPRRAVFYRIRISHPRIQGRNNCIFIVHHSVHVMACVVSCEIWNKRKSDIKDMSATIRK